jgi:D-beta-D-heptose 7-phosphate kinase/D-beta-D-heptose 1-phosphate adenosyltransferase
MKKKIAVVGDFMLDHYFHGEAKRLSPEAPVPVVLVKEEKYLLGGAGNVVRNIKGFGAEVYAFGIIGKDQEGAKIINLLINEGVFVNNIFQSDSHITTLKSRIVVDGHQIVRVDKEKLVESSLNLQKKVIDNLISIIHEVDVLVLSDYGKGMLNDNLLREIINLCNRKGVKVLVDPKGKDFTKYQGAYLATPNKLEAILATGVEIFDKKTIKTALTRLKDILQNENQIITLGSEGIAMLRDEDFSVFPALSKDVIDVTGAGDTVIASLAFQLAVGKSLEESIVFSNKAASIVVQKKGSAVVTLGEIEKLSKKDSSMKVFNNIDDFEEIYNEIRIDKKVVFTNGCFDILHSGHVKYLKEAKSKGDLLIVGLNSDPSVSSIKGPKRPVNDQAERATILSALEFVDYVVIFNEETPFELLKIIKPDLLVKGGDYDIQNVVGREFAKETILIPFVEGKSTSEVIKKIIQHN